MHQICAPRSAARSPAPAAPTPRPARRRSAPAAALRAPAARRAAARAAAPRAVRVSASAAAQVAELSSKFGIPGHVEFVEGRGGLPTVVLTHACGATAEVVLFGGVITSFKQASGDEVLYVRPDAVFDRSKPISGGVPHCFPQFGPGAMQQHGFARNLDWGVAASSADAQPDDRDPEVQLVLTDNDYTRAMWPHAFSVAYSVALHGELLRTDMRVVNTGDKPFDFTAALHTYFEVAGVENARVRGLKGLVSAGARAGPRFCAFVHCAPQHIRRAHFLLRTHPLHPVTSPCPLSLPCVTCAAGVPGQDGGRQQPAPPDRDPRRAGLRRPRGLGLPQGQRPRGAGRGHRRRRGHHLQQLER
jgi:hypothetical protein